MQKELKSYSHSSNEELPASLLTTEVNPFAEQDRQRVQNQERLLKRYIEDHSNFSFLDGLVDRTKEAYKAIPTGFQNLDGYFLGGIRPGIWFFGGMPSTGKTTFCLQMADNLAKNGHKVLYFSLEMKRDELMLKSLARETFEYTSKPSSINGNPGKNEAVSAIEISQGKGDPAVIGAALQSYLQYSKNLFIFDDLAVNGGRTDAEAIALRVEEFIKTFNPDHPKYDDEGKRCVTVDGLPLYETDYKNLKVKPVVFIDYLQIMEPKKGFEGSAEKLIIDQNIKGLHAISMKYDIPVISIVSFNRQAYRKQASMESMKGTGEAEFYAQGAVGLQTPRNFKKLDGYSADQASDKQYLDQMKENGAKAAAGKAIDIEAVIMKNRKGPKDVTAYFKYFPKYDCFKMTRKDD